MCDHIAAILFPKIFYPMMVGPTQKGNRDPIGELSDLMFR